MADDSIKAKLLRAAKMPVGKEAKKKLDEWLNENINIPLSMRGHDKIGSVISAIASAGGELVIPDDLAEAALSVIPGAKLVRAGQKGMKALKVGDKAVDAAKAAGKIDYGDIKKSADGAKATAERAAPKIDYEKVSIQESIKKKQMAKQPPAKPTSIDYDAIKKGEVEARAAKRAAQESSAETLTYLPKGKIVKKPPSNLTDEKLRAMEKARELRKAARQNK